MSTAQQDTEITFGTGRMLAIFFVFVLVCAFFFAIGFSLGRKTTTAVNGLSMSPSAGTPASAVRPSPAKNDAHGAPTPTPQSGDFSFYKAVGEKNADAALTPPEAKTPTENAAAPAADKTPKAATETAPATPAAGSYYVQVAAVTRKEDADALVEALKKKQYPAFTTSTPSVDKFVRIQVGPYAEWKDAEAMRTRLIGDGYNPIVKK